MSEPAGRHAPYPEKYPEMQALWALTQGRRLARELASAGVDQILLLRGPELQQRLFGTPAIAMCANLNLLVRRRAFGHVRKELCRLGFTPHPSQGIRWPFARHGRFERRGFAVELRSHLRLWPYPGWSFRTLASELWRGASRGEGGFLQPPLGPLTVYLAAHAASRGFEPPVLASFAPAAAAGVDDASEVRDIAARSRLTGVVKRAIGGSPGSGPAQEPGERVLLRDGRWAGVRWRMLRWMRTKVVPRGLIDRLAELVSYRRQGIAVLRPRKDSRQIALPSAGLASSTPAAIEIEVWEGVLGPGPSAWALVEAWLRAAGVEADFEAASASSPAASPAASPGTGVRWQPRGRPPVLVEVGTGTGALAILAKLSCPQASIDGTDIAARAVSDARANVARAGLPITLHRGNLLQPLPASLRGRVDAILAHLPTIPPSGPVDEPPSTEAALSMAPREASRGPGGDGLGLVRRLLRTAPAWLAPQGALVFTLQPWQWNLVASEASLHGFELDAREDLSAHLLIVTLRLAPRAPGKA